MPGVFVDETTLSTILWFQHLSITLWAISIVGIPGGLILRKPNISYGSLLAFLMLSIDVFMAINMKIAIFAQGE